MQKHYRPLLWFQLSSDLIFYEFFEQDVTLENRLKLKLLVKLIFQELVPFRGLSVMWLQSVAQWNCVLCLKKKVR